MTKKVEGAKRGRPKGSGDGLAYSLLTRVDESIASRLGLVMEAEGMSRAEALRMVIEMGLSAWESETRKAKKK